MTASKETSLTTSRLFKSEPARKFQIGSTVQHWQLRDLVKCNSEMYPHEVAFLRKKSVKILNSETGSVRTLFGELKFSPLCFDVRYGYVAVGGLHSHFSWTNRIDLTKRGSFENSDTTNNTMTIGKYRDIPSLFVCNNDESVKICDLPAFAAPTGVKIGFPVNCLALSEEQDKMIVTGDSNEAKVFMLNSSGPTLAHTYEVPLSTSCFGCSWNLSSEKFSVASEDGHIYVFDVRSTKPLCNIKSLNSCSEEAAVRVAAFSKTPGSDFLLFTEQQRYVHLVDARSFATQDVLDLSKELNMDNEINGACFSSDGRYVYVSTEDYMLRKEIDMKARRCFQKYDVI